jgi:hypothetical protein
MDAAISFKNITTQKDINLIYAFIYDNKPQPREEDEIIAIAFRKAAIEVACEKWNLNNRTKSTSFRDKLIADAKASGCIGTSEEITFLESQLNKGCMGAVEAIEYIYKRSNPKLKIIEASPEIEEK